MADAHAEQGRLALFPITFFSLTLGLGGWAIATQKVAGTLSLPGFTSDLVLALDILVFTAVLLFYGAKAALFPDEVRKELIHPVKISFFPTASIGLLLMSVAFLEINHGASYWLWLTGTTLHAALTLFIIREWIFQDRFEISHMNPAWFIPVVGNIVIPIAGVHHASPDVSWFFFSTGIVMWIVFLAIVMNRMIFHRSIPDRMLPTLFILVAPPAVGFIAYVKLAGDLDPFARILFFFAAFMLAFLATLAGRFGRIRFFLSWWAYTFPVAAFTIACSLMGRLTSTGFYEGLAVLLWIFLGVLIGFLSLKTVLSMVRREVCVEE